MNKQRKIRNNKKQKKGEFKHENDTKKWRNNTNSFSNNNCTKFLVPRNGPNE